MDWASRVKARAGPELRPGKGLAWYPEVSHPDDSRFELAEGLEVSFLRIFCFLTCSHPAHRCATGLRGWYAHLGAVAIRRADQRNSDRSGDPQPWNFGTRPDFQALVRDAFHVHLGHRLR